MKSLLVFILAFVTIATFAQQKTLSPLEVINFKSKLLTFYTNGEKEDFGQEIKIAFYKDYVLFETPTYHLKGQTSVIDFNNTKDGDTIIDDTDPDMTVEKITYLYYVYKIGGKTGLFYDEENLKTKLFFVDTLFKHSNIGVNEESLSADLGKPKEVKKIGKGVFEKYYGFKKEDGVDTIFRNYDENLKWVTISLSKKLDQEKGSKLIKSLEIVKYKHSLEIKRGEPYRLEILDQIELVTDKCSKAVLGKFMRYFDKYQEHILKEPTKSP